MTDVDDLWQSLVTELALQMISQPKIQEYDAAVLRRLSGWQEQAETCGHPADHGLEYGSPKAPHVPRRRDHVDLCKAAPYGLEGLLECQRWELASVLLAIEPLLLENQNWDALPE